MLILAIESSCDETSVSIVENGTRILSNVVVSQIDIFKSYGGVIPEIAARSHLEAILPVLDRAFADASLTWDDIDAIAVTHTPGLLGSLLIGTLTARTFALLHHKPFYPVHHLKSHIYANWLDTDHTPTFPLLALVVSGGHTQLIHMPSPNTFEIVGTTLDDAVGECFDKVAKILGLPYPGGPAISAAALSGDRHRYSFPHPHTDHPLDFSFSGLKTAVLRTVQSELGLPISYPSHELHSLLTPDQISDFAASFEQTAIDYLLEKLARARELYPDAQSLVLAGGVSANHLLRSEFLSRFQPKNAQPKNPQSKNSLSKNSQSQPPQLFFPSPSLSGDNAAMVAAAAFFEIQSGVQPSDPYSLDILPRSIIS